LAFFPRDKKRQAFLGGRAPMTHEPDAWNGRKISFSLGDYIVRNVNPHEGGAIQALADRASDYFEMVYGESPPGDFGEKFFSTAPENRSSVDVILLGIFEQPEKLIGLIHCATDCPEKGTWYIGLVLLEPAVRNKGLGRRIHRAFASFAKRNGADQLMLSTVDENERGSKFWESLEYVRTGSLPERLFGRKRQTRTEFTLKLGKEQDPVGRFLNAGKQKGTGQISRIDRRAFGGVFRRLTAGIRATYLVGAAL
jgi:GNAT superfamily N-acetyltransferase